MKYRAIGLDTIGPEVYSAGAPEDAIKKESNFSRRLAQPENP